MTTREEVLAQCLFFCAAGLSSEQGALEYSDFGRDGAGKRNQADDCGKLRFGGAKEKVTQRIVGKVGKKNAR